MSYISSFDLARIIRDAKTRKRKTVYLPNSIYTKNNLELVKKFYGLHYKIKEVTGSMNGLEIEVGN